MLYYAFLLYLICNPTLTHAKCLCTAKNLHPLNEVEIRIAQRLYPEWKLVTKEQNPYFKKEVTKNIELLITKAAQTAEILQHHPDITLSGSTMTIAIFTHALNNITNKDLLFIKTFEKEIPTITPHLKKTKKQAKIEYTIEEKKDAIKIIFASSEDIFGKLCELFSPLLLNKEYLKECKEITISYGEGSLLMQNITTQKVEPSTKAFTDQIITRITQQSNNRLFNK